MSGTIEQQAFAVALAKETGLRADVVGAWVESEGKAAGAHNWLNVRLPGRTRGLSGVPITTDARGFAVFRNASDAVKETAYWINRSPNYKGIRATKGGAAGAQLGAIARSPWDANHYRDKKGHVGGTLIGRFIEDRIGGRNFFDRAASGVTGAAGDLASGALGVATAPFTVPLHAADKVATSVEQGIADAGKSLAKGLIEGAVMLALLVLALLLFYQGVRRLSGDALPSASEVAGAAGSKAAGAKGSGAEMAAVAA